MSDLSHHWMALGLSEGATALEIKAAFRRRALAVHPDKGGSAEAFREVLVAFEALVAKAHLGALAAYSASSASAKRRASRRAAPDFAATAATAAAATSSSAGNHSNKSAAPDGEREKNRRPPPVASAKRPCAKRGKDSADANSQMGAAPCQGARHSWQPPRAPSAASRDLPTAAASAGLARPVKSPPPASSRATPATFRAAACATNEFPLSAALPTGSVLGAKAAAEAASLVCKHRPRGQKAGHSGNAGTPLREPLIFGARVRGEPFLLRFCRLIRRLPPQRRRDVLKNKLSQRKRLALERWMEIKRESTREDGTLTRPRQQSSSNDAAGSSSSSTTDETESSSEESIAGLADIETEPPLAICDDDVSGLNGSQMDSIRIRSSMSVESRDLCERHVEQPQAEANAESTNLCHGEETREDNYDEEDANMDEDGSYDPMEGEDEDEDKDTGAREGEQGGGGRGPNKKRNKIMRGVHSNMNKYFAIGFIHMMKLQSRRTVDLAMAIEFHMVFVDMKRRIGAWTSKDDREAGFFETRFKRAMDEALLEYGLSFAAVTPMITIEVPASYWIGRKLPYAQMGIEAGLRMRWKLHETRGRVIRGGPQAMLKHFSPLQLGQVWQRVRATYLEWFREHGHRPYHEEVERIDRLHQEHAPSRERSLENWNTARMTREEQYQLALRRHAIRTEAADRARLAIEATRKRAVTRQAARAHQRERRAMFREDLRHRELARVERRNASIAEKLLQRERRAISRAFREVRRLLRSKTAIMRAEHGVEALLTKWESYEERQAQAQTHARLKRQLLGLRQRKAIRRRERESKLRQRREVARVLAEERRKRAEREERWRNRRRSDLTI